MLDDALLQSEALMHRSSSGRSVARVDNDRSRSSTREGCINWSFSNENCGSLELLEHELGQSKSCFLVMNWWLGEKERGFFWVDHQSLNQAFAKYILKVVKIRYT